jgi:amino acid transporter
MSAMAAQPFTDEWLDARERRLRGAVGAIFGVAAVLNFLSVVVGVEGSLWLAIRVAVGVVFLVALAAWLAAILMLRVPGGEDLARRRTWVRRVRIIALTVAAGTLVAALVTGNFPTALAMLAVVGALAYELVLERRREAGT